MFEHETNNVFDMFGGVLTAYARPCMPYQPISGFVVVGSRKVVVGQDPFEGTRRSKAARWLLEGTSSLTIPVHTVPSEVHSRTRRSETSTPDPYSWLMVLVLTSLIRSTVYTTCPPPSPK